MKYYIFPVFELHNILIFLLFFFFFSKKNKISRLCLKITARTAIKLFYALYLFLLSVEKEKIKLRPNVKFAKKTCRDTENDAVISSKV